MTKHYRIEHTELRICLYNTLTNKLYWVYNANYISFANPKNIICWYINGSAKYWYLPKHITVINCDGGCTISIYSRKDKYR